jgi:hypothetical protein
VVKPLTVSVRYGEIRASDPQQVTVRHLLPRERVRLTSQGDVVGNGRANASGVFRAEFKVGQVWGTYTVRARSARTHQTATASFHVHIRCLNGEPVCD